VFKARGGAKPRVFLSSPLRDLMGPLSPPPPDPKESERTNGGATTPNPPFKTLKNYCSYKQSNGIKKGTEIKRSGKKFSYFSLF
jgi:hypothetical protein